MEGHDRFDFLVVGSFVVKGEDASEGLWNQGNEQIEKHDNLHNCAQEKDDPIFEAQLCLEVHVKFGHRIEVRDLPLLDVGFKNTRIDISFFDFYRVWLFLENENLFESEERVSKGKCNDKVHNQEGHEVGQHIHADTNDPPKVLHRVQLHQKSWPNQQGAPRIDPPEVLLIYVYTIDFPRNSIDQNEHRHENIENFRHSEVLFAGRKQLDYFEDDSEECDKV